MTGHPRTARTATCGLSLSLCARRGRRRRSSPAARSPSPQAAAPDVIDGGMTLADATLVDDPKGYVGPSTALLAEAAIPVPDVAPDPALPVTVTDMQGTEVTVTDTSRILALDIYGTPRRTVFELGLGDQLVGRDISTAFPEAADLPARHPERPRPQRRGDPRARPDRHPHRHHLGPWDVVLQMRDAGIPVVVVDSERCLENVGDAHRRRSPPPLGRPGGGRRARRAHPRRRSTPRSPRSRPSRPQDAAERLRIAFLYVRGRPASTTCSATDSGADALIDALGGVDVATEIGWKGMRPLTDEGLVAAAARPRARDDRGPRVRRRRRRAARARSPRCQSTPAGENRRIVDMGDTEILSFGPTTADVLEALAVALYAPDGARRGVPATAAVARAPAAWHPRGRRPGRALLGGLSVALLVLAGRLGRQRPAATSRPREVLRLAPAQARPRHRRRCRHPPATARPPSGQSASRGS